MKTLTDELYTRIINKQLEPYGKTVDDIKDDPKWFQTYTMTTEQNAAWKKWAIDLLRKELKWSKQLAEREFVWIDLNHGLMIKD